METVKADVGGEVQRKLQGAEVWRHALLSMVPFGGRSSCLVLATKCTEVKKEAQSLFADRERKFQWHPRIKWTINALVTLNSSSPMWS